MSQTDNVDRFNCLVDSSPPSPGDMRLKAIYAKSQRSFLGHALPIADVTVRLTWGGRFRALFTGRVKVNLGLDVSAGIVNIGIRSTSRS